MDQSAWQHLWPLISAKAILHCSDLQGSQVFALDSVLKFRREVRVWLNGEALPFLPLTAIVTLNFQVFCRGES